MLRSSSIAFINISILVLNVPDVFVISSTPELNLSTITLTPKPVYSSKIYVATITVPEVNNILSINEILFLILLDIQ